LREKKGGRIRGAAGRKNPLEGKRENRQKTPRSSNFLVIRALGEGRPPKSRLVRKGLRKSREGDLWGEEAGNLLLSTGRA